MNIANITHKSKEPPTKTPILCACNGEGGTHACYVVAEYKNKRFYRWGLYPINRDYKWQEIPKEGFIDC